MKYLLLMGIFPDSLMDYILSHNKGVMQFAADNFQKSLINGFYQNIQKEDIYVLNAPFIGGYPTLSSAFRIPNTLIRFNNENIGYSVDFCNLRLYKNQSIYKNIKHNLVKWCELNDHDDKSIIVYSLNEPFIKACCFVKKLYPSIKIVLVVPDLIEFMGASCNPFLHLHRFIQKIVFKYLFQNIDYWVLVSKHMRNRLPIKDNYIVVEGIYNDVLGKSASNTDKFRIFYGGTLAKRYGILNLVQAFNKISKKNIELIICGDGDASSEINKIASIDNRIILMGQLTRVEMLKLMTTSDLLVNPRNAEGEYTKYSFPSKNIEYLASGIPTLLYELPGIPDEYYSYCFTLKDNSIDALKNKIEDILLCDKSFLESMGAKAREFIYSSKNSRIQVKRIIDMIK